ncbi:hypothetical protein EI94DRAFT_1707055 [Lactarius quietus]|nr:hypothetical protein EI94DRAFT_1707055 [Lactarius quietus]
MVWTMPVSTYSYAMGFPSWHRCFGGLKKFWHWEVEHCLGAAAGTACNGRTRVAHGMKAPVFGRRLQVLSGVTHLAQDAEGFTRKFTRLTIRHRQTLCGIVAFLFFGIQVVVALVSVTVAENIAHG